MPSFVNNRTPVLKQPRRLRRGQTAVVALLVLLLLSFIGALFITIIARNLQTQGRTHRTLNADYYAESGLRFADDQLTANLDGADWRPPLQYALATIGPVNYVTQLIGPAGSPAYARYQAAGLTAANPNDPDKAYLDQGFTRYNTQNGRFLLRVTYDPIGLSTADNPTARYIKIESVGREGLVNPVDPTTYQNQPPTRLAATLVAYKPIAITDYARFETNIDRRSDVMNLGVPGLYTPVNATNAQYGIVTPGVFDFSQGTNSSGVTILTLSQYPVITTYGDPTADAGGSFFANASVRFYGINTFYLASGSRADGVSVAGNILLNDYDPKAALDNSTLDAGTNTGQDAAVLFNPPSAARPPLAAFVAPSNGYDSVNGVGTPFDTKGGVFRDVGSGSSASDAYGNPRSVARLDPPAIDTANSATRLTRYQAITENSLPRIDPATMTTAPTGSPPSNDPFTGNPYAAPNAALYGYGRSVYINNPTDIQRDSPSLVGGHTLVDEWLNANPGGQASTTTKGGWVGPFYNPPGAEIVFGRQSQTFGAGGTLVSTLKYGFRITRSDVDTDGHPVVWTDPSGQTPLGPTMTVTYDELNASNDLKTTPAAQQASSLANPNNDVLIYAEGNVRVRGILSAAVPASGEDDDSRPRHITVITNGTAYIDGNIIKGNPDSSITILARDYVCVNTTQFLAGAAGVYPAVSDGLLTFGPETGAFVQEFSFGVPPSAYSGTSPLALYISSGAGSAGSVIADFDIADPLGTPTTSGQPPSINGGGNPFDASLFTPTFDSSLGAGPSLVTHTTYNLSTLGTLTGATTQQPFQLWMRRDPGMDAFSPTATSANSTADQPFQLERAAILPMDIRIEAVLYAQNKSFFVIPGPWFNTDTGDDLLTYNTALQAYQAAPTATTAVAPTRPGINQAVNDQSRFPFYGQPLDLKITIAGAVSEARPADISAQAAWTQKWGWIPQYHGSGFLNADGTARATPETAGHAPNSGFPATGLTFVYDPLDGYPYSASANSYLRTDVYGRPLPVTPKLPVSTGLLYAGQNPGPSLLQ